MDMERVPLKTRLCWLKNGNDSADRCVEMLRKQAEMPVLDYCMRDVRLLDALGAALHLSREVLFHIDTLDDALKDVATHNMKNCSAACARMKAGLETLAENDKAWDAFQLANRAMYMQRAHLKLQEQTANEERFPGDAELSALLESVEGDGYEMVDQKISDYYAWHLFQIAFLMMSVNSIILDNGPDRKLVDLIWFPTGGGKTEAYLGNHGGTV